MLQTPSLDTSVAKTPTGKPSSPRKPSHAQKATRGNNQFRTGQDGWAPPGSRWDKPHQAPGRHTKPTRTRHSKMQGTDPEFTCLPDPGTTRAIIPDHDEDAQVVHSPMLAVAVDKPHTDLPNEHRYATDEQMEAGEDSCRLGKCGLCGFICCSLKDENV